LSQTSLMLTIHKCVRDKTSKIKISGAKILNIEIVGKMKILRVIFMFINICIGLNIVSTVVYMFSSYIVLCANLNINYYRMI